MDNQNENSAGTPAQKHPELIRLIEKYGDEEGVRRWQEGEGNPPEEVRKYLRLSPPVPRQTHPAFYRHRFVCKRIEQITRSDHGTYLVLVQRDTEYVDYVTIDCTTILDIVVDAEDQRRISFLYELYFTEKERAELHTAYLRGEFDDLGDDVPGY